MTSPHLLLPSPKTSLVYLSHLGDKEEILIWGRNETQVRDTLRSREHGKKTQILVPTATKLKCTWQHFSSKYDDCTKDVDNEDTVSFTLQGPSRYFLWILIIHYQNALSHMPLPGPDDTKHLPVPTSRRRRHGGVNELSKALGLAWRWVDSTNHTLVKCRELSSRSDFAKQLLLSLNNCFNRSVWHRLSWWIEAACLIALWSYEDWLIRNGLLNYKYYRNV